VDFLPQRHPFGSQYSGYWAPVKNPLSFVRCLNYYFCQKTLGLRAFQAQTGKQAKNGLQSRSSENGMMDDWHE